MRLALLRAPLPGWRYRLAHWAGKSLDHGPYSHGEIIFSDKTVGSAWLDGGVQVRQMPPEHYDADIWDFFSLPDEMEAQARAWFEAHAGEPYDLIGPARFALGILRQRSERWYCHEAIAESLGLADSWRYTGGLLLAVGPRIWPGSFKRVGGPYPLEWPKKVLRCVYA